MQTSTPTDFGPARELELALLIVDLSGYTALTETHGALHASEVVLRFQRLAAASLEPGVAIVNSIGDDVFFAGAGTLAVVRTALRLRDSVARESGYPRVRTGVHRGLIVEREGRYFGAPINLTARLAAEADGGQILCTKPVVEAIGALADIEAIPVGERRFKNIADPVAVFELARVSERRAASMIDPVCRMQVPAGGAAATARHLGRTYYFCSLECARLFEASANSYAEPEGGREGKDR